MAIVKVKSINDIKLPDIPKIKGGNGEIYQYTGSLYFKKIPFNQGDLTLKENQERLEMCFHHLEYLSKIKCEKVTVLEMRSHIAWYLKGLPDSIDTKNKCFKATTIEELKEILNNYFNKLENSV